MEVLRERDMRESVPVWVIDERGLVLGKTYRKAAGLKLDEMDDGSCSATTFTPDKTAMV